MSKRFLSVLLTALMAAALSASAVFADETDIVEVTSEQSADDSKAESVITETETDSPDITPAADSEEAQTADPEEAAEPEEETAETAEEDASVQDGTYQQIVDEETGKKYLVDSNGVHATGFQELDKTNNWIVYCDPEDDGAFAVNCTKTIEGYTFLFDANGLWLINSGTLMVNGNKYWVDENGHVRTGWMYLGNWKMYYDTTDFSAAVGFKEINGKMYLFDNNGVMQNYAGTTIINGKKYWFSDDDASLKTGWMDLGAWMLYFDPITYECYTNGVYEIDGDHYLFDVNGVLNKNSGTPMWEGKKYWINTEYKLGSGWMYLGNMKIYFDPVTFAACTGVNEIDGKHWLFDDNGVLRAEAGTPMINGYKYWFAEDGSLLSGWLQLGDWRMYFDPTTYRAAIGAAVIDGENYLFDSNGILITGNGLVERDGNLYYFNENGSIATGWIDIDGSTYYFDPTTFKAATGIAYIDGGKYVFTAAGVNIKCSGAMIMVDGNKYCFDPYGAPVTGWYQAGDYKMYFDPTTGIAATGVTTIDGKTYYFNADGIAIAGRYLENGKMYYTDSNGELLRNTWTVYNGEKIYVDSDGTGLVDLSDIYPGPYMLYVDRTNNVVMAYAQDSDGNYTIPVRAMVCSTGTSSDGNDTPAGTFSLGTKYVLKELMGPSWGQFASTIYATYGIYFHSVATGSADDPVHTVPVDQYNLLGQQASHGCVRLTVRDALWIYTYCDEGTTVVVGDNFPMPFGKPTATTIETSVDPTDPAV